MLSQVMLVIYTCRKIGTIFCTHSTMEDLHKFSFLFASLIPIIVTYYFLQLASFLRYFKKLRKATVSFVMSLCPSTWNSSASTGLICVEYEDFSKNLSRKFNIHFNMRRKTDILHEDLRTFMTISH
jgi:hypothetical protein